jgi:uncharacterized membrane protein
MRNPVFALAVYCSSFSHFMFSLNDGHFHGNRDHAIVHNCIKLAEKVFKSRRVAVEGQEVVPSSERLMGGL